MAASHLRIYNGPTESPASFESATSGQHNVTISVGEVLPLLADAIESQRTWLRDFSDDDITISSDLYEVLLAYQHFRRRPGA